MSPCTVAALCAAVGRQAAFGDSAAVVTGVTTDSRASDGQLFIPLTGERFDGHAYIDSALSAGAAGCLTARVPETMQPGKFYIQVADTRLALKALAAWCQPLYPAGGADHRLGGKDHHQGDGGGCPVPAVRHPENTG